MPGGPAGSAIPKRGFDRVVSIGVLNHTPAPAKAFAELVRVAAPVGHVFVLVYARWTPHHLAYFSSGWLRRRPVDTLDRFPAWLLAFARAVIAARVEQRLPDPEIKALLADQM